MAGYKNLHDKLSSNRLSDDAEWRKKRDEVYSNLASQERAKSGNWEMKFYPPKGSQEAKAKGQKIAASRRKNQEAAAEAFKD